MCRGNTPSLFMGVFVLVLMRMCMSMILSMRLSMSMRLLVQLPVFMALRSKSQDQFCAFFFCLGDPPQPRSIGPDKYRVGIARRFCLLSPAKQRPGRTTMRVFVSWNPFLCEAIARITCVCACMRAVAARTRIRTLPIETVARNKIQCSWLTPLGAGISA